MYTVYNYKTKKALKAAVANGDIVQVYQSNKVFNTPVEGMVTLEGPHSPEPHRWYAQGWLEGGRLVKIK